MSPARHIALFGLSSDPPTGEGGHVGIVRWAATRLGVDEVWVVPVYQHAFHEKQRMTAYEHRLAMAKLAFERIPDLEGRVRVKEVEREAAVRLAGVEPFVGTLDVVRMLRHQHPEARFSLVMGGDTYRDYLEGKWKGGRALEKEVSIVALKRGQWGEGNAGPGAPRLTDVSSRALRASVDAQFWEHEVPALVRAYVKANHLYAYGAD